MLFALSLGIAALLIVVPAFLAEPSDAARIGLYAEDYEGNLCGHLATRADGGRGRDLRTRPFAYWLNETSAVCVRTCPRLADELVCEYPFEGVPASRQREQLGLRCFLPSRTRPSFPACLPHKPTPTAHAIDRWLGAHAIDQLAADTLQASGVILGCWCAAGLAALLFLGALIAAPSLALGTSMVLGVGTALGGALLLLPHGTRILAAARAPLERHEAVYWREEVPGVLQFALGWVACASVGLLVITLYNRARHAPLAAALLSTAARPLIALPQLLLLPLYLFVALGTPLSMWISAIVFLASPCAQSECGFSATAARILWPLTLAAPYWLAAVVTAWSHVAVGGTVARWYSELPAEDAAAVGGASLRTDTAGGPKLNVRRGARGGTSRWLLWRSGWLAADQHFGSIGTAAALLPLASSSRILLPPVEHGPARALNPYSRLCLNCMQGMLRATGALTRAVHPGALVYLSRYEPIGPEVHGARRQDVSGEKTGAATTASRADGFLDAGDRCADLFAAGGPGSRVAFAREQCHYFYSLLKWSISLGVALIGWLCLTAEESPPLLSPLWPAAIILEGSLALVSAALSVHEAALEAVLQSYAAEVKHERPRAREQRDAPRQAHRRATKRADEFADEGLENEDASFERARHASTRAATLFGVSSLSASEAYPQLAAYPAHATDLAPTYGTLATAGPMIGSGGPIDLVSEGLHTTRSSSHLGEIPQVPPSYGALPLAASALAGA